MAAVSESGEPHNVGENHRTRFGSVYLQRQPRYDRWIGLIADGDDPGHGERRKTSSACGRCLGQAGKATGTGFIDEDDIRLAADRNRARALRTGGVLPYELADQGHLWGGYAR